MKSILISVVMLMALQCAASQSEPSGGCIGVAASNAWVVKATIDRQNLDARVERADGTEIVHSTLPRTDAVASECRAFVSGDDKHVAIAAAVSAARDAVDVWVWNVGEAKFQSSFRVRSSAELRAPVEVIGFAPASDHLVYLAHSDDGYRLATSDMAGHIEAGEERARWGWTDLPNNRVWITREPDSCAIVAMPVFQPSSKEVSVDRSLVQSDCVGPQPISFPTPGTVVGAFVSNNTAWVWKAVPETKDVSKLRIPTPAKHPGDRWIEVSLGKAVSSRSGKFVGIERTITHWGRSDRINESWKEIDVVETNPLKLVAQIREPGCSDEDAFALVQGASSLKAVAHWCDAWKSSAVSLAPKEMPAKNEPTSRDRSGERLPTNKAAH